MAGDKPIFMYAVNTFSQHAEIGLLVMVVAKEWTAFVSSWLQRLSCPAKIVFAQAGDSRQHSVYNGLKCLHTLLKPDDRVIIHDAARPLVSLQLITDCLENMQGVDGVMPVIAVKDTIYASADGENIDGLLNRDELFAGQAPECFLYGKYYDLHCHTSLQDIHKIKGSTEIAVKNGLKVKLIRGDEANFKITTREDLRMFDKILNDKKECL